MNSDRKEEFLKMEIEMWEAAKNQDRNKFMTIVMPNAVMLCGGLRCSGEQYGDIIAFFDCKTYEIEDFEIINEDEKSVQVHYILHIEVNNDNNSELAGSFHITTTWAKFNGVWKVIYNMEQRIATKIIKGLHHVSLKCTEPDKYKEVINFYNEILNMPIIRQWNEGVMFDTGSGLIEVFNNGEENLPKGVIRHFALATNEVDALSEKIRLAGYEVFFGPKDIVIPSKPPFNAKVAFCKGPLGEEIELFTEMSN